MVTYIVNHPVQMYVMTSSPSNGDAFMLSRTFASRRMAMIQSLKMNPFSGIGLVSDLFHPPMYS